MFASLLNVRLRRSRGRAGCSCSQFLTRPRRVASGELCVKSRAGKTQMIMPCCRYENSAFEQLLEGSRGSPGGSDSTLSRTTGGSRVSLFGAGDAPSVVVITDQCHPILAHLSRTWRPGQDGRQYESQEGVVWETLSMVRAGTVAVDCWQCPVPSRAPRA